ncbi:MAG: hypothetical protein KC464_23405, partial [Myxococcales bacterium]|nr:hypothetical protein [Myxococcales bacterium]
GGGGGEAPATPAGEVRTTGTYAGDWGRITFQFVGDDAWGAYEHDAGTVRGTLHGDTLVGRWCETPSRQPGQDGGDVELTFVTDADGTRRIDGRWRYGGNAANVWRDDWDATWVDDVADPALTARFADPAAFCAP